MSKLPRLPIGAPIVDSGQRATVALHRYLETLTVNLESQLGALQAAQAAQAAATLANAAAAAAQTAANTANTAAGTAQTAATTANNVATTVTAANAIATSYVTGLTLMASDAGTNVTVTISAHTRVYGDGTSVAVNSGTVTGRPYSTTQRIYYDDAGRAGGAVTYQATTVATVAAQTGSRHSVGAVITPASAGSPVNGKAVDPPGYASI